LPGAWISDSALQEIEVLEIYMRRIFKMVGKRKRGKIDRMMKASGVVDNFEKLLRVSIENISMQLTQLGKLVEKEDKTESGPESENLERMIQGLKDESRELYIKEASERKEEIMNSLALVYAKHLTERDVDAMIKIYSSDVWQSMVKLHPVFQQEAFNLMSKHDHNITVKILEVVSPKIVKMKAVYYAKRAYRFAKECGLNNKESLDAYNRAYKEVMEEE